MKAKILIEVILVYLLTQILNWFLRPIWFFKWESEVLGFSFTGGLINISISLLLIYLTKKEFKSYGIKKENWETSLDVGLFSWIFVVFPVIFLIFLGLDYMKLLDSLILGGAIVGSLLLFLVILRKQENQERQELDSETDSDEKMGSRTKTNLILLAILLSFPIILAIVLTMNPAIIGRSISIITFQVVFSGFGEELRYRGYFQSRINQGLGTPYNFLGVSFGSGIIIAAAFFGISHIFNSFSPFEGIFTLEWGWGIYTFFTGFFFGFIMEKTRNLIGPGISHSSDAFGQALFLLFG